MEDSISDVNEPVISDKLDDNTLSTTNKRPIFAVRSQQMPKRKWEREKNEQLDQRLHAKHTPQHGQIAELINESEAKDFNTRLIQELAELNTIGISGEINDTDAREKENNMTASIERKLCFDAITDMNVETKFKDHERVNDGNNSLHCEDKLALINKAENTERFLDDDYKIQGEISLQRAMKTVMLTKQKRIHLRT